MLTTQAGLAITGDSAENLLAIRTTDGTVLWHYKIGRLGGAPVTFRLDGKQYLPGSGANMLYAYALQ